MFHVRVSTWLVTASSEAWWTLMMAGVTSTPADSMTGARCRVGDKLLEWDEFYFNKRVSIRVVMSKVFSDNKIRQS